MKTKYHPILFSTLMVQGIDENRKNQTRRTKGLEKINENPDEWKFEALGTNPDNENDKNLHAYFTIKDTETWMHVKCPYNVGDVLWVRETFVSSYTVDGYDREQFLYKANKGSEEILKSFGWKWKPSLFMPKHACRTFLKIKSIRAERLQDISEGDAIAEGATQFELGFTWLEAKYGFQMIWEDINGKDSWNRNPFVWVYEFEKIEKPEDFGLCQP